MQNEDDFGVGYVAAVGTITADEGEGERVNNLTSFLFTPSFDGETARLLSLGVDSDLPALFASMSSISYGLEAVGEMDLGRGW